MTTNKETFIPGEQVAVSDTSVENAIKDLETDNFKAYYIGIKRDGKYVIENSHGYFYSTKYVSKIPQPQPKKSVTLELTEEQEKQIREQFNIN